MRARSPRSPSAAGPIGSCPSERSALAETEADQRIVLGDEDSHLATVGKTTSARVPPPVARAQLEATVETLLDHAPDEAEAEARRRARRASPPSSTRSRVCAPPLEPHDDRRRAVLEGVRDELVGDDPELLGGRRVERDRLGFDRHRHRRAGGDAAQERGAVDSDPRPRSAGGARLRSSGSARPSRRMPHRSARRGGRAAAGRPPSAGRS